MHNTGLRVTNTSGVKGVSKHGKGWRAFITVDYKRRHVGTFATMEEATFARQAAEIQYVPRIYQ